MAVDCLSSLNVRRNSLRLRGSPYSQYTVCTISVNTIMYIHMYILYFHGARRFGIIHRRQSTHTTLIALKQCSLHQTCAVCAVSALLYTVLSFLVVISRLSVHRASLHRDFTVCSFALLRVVKGKSGDELLRLS